MEQHGNSLKLPLLQRVFWLKIPERKKERTKDLVVAAVLQGFRAIDTGTWCLLRLPRTQDSQKTHCSMPAKAL